jgi:hypothetical protein
LTIWKAGSENPEDVPRSGVVIVLADDRDAAAARLSQSWARDGALLMTAADLSRPGWRCNLASPRRSRACIGGTLIEASGIRGILVRTSAVAASRLTMFAEAERDYAAAEMNAFLVYWLGAIGRPVLNRPTPRCLGGPGWYPEHWVHCAASLGIAVAALSRCVVPGRGDDGAACGEAADMAQTSITVIGDRCFGGRDPALLDASRRLARAADVDLVRILFDGSDSSARFRCADPYPALEDEEIANAVLGYFDATDSGR